MGHPLTPKLSELTMDELTKKIGELNGRLSMAYRWGRGDLVQQIYLLLEDYQSELNERQRKQLEDLQKQSPNFEKLIDIK